MSDGLYPLPDPEQSHAAIQIHTLGTPAVTWAGAPLVMPRRQSRALLYRLAATSQPAPRDQLSFLFWPDVPEAAARRNLVVLLNHVRRALPRPEALVSSDDTVGLHPRAVWSDAVVASRSISVALQERRLDLLAQAADLFRGPFLDGFGLPSGGEFEEWAEREREAWEHRYLEALSALIEGNTAQGRYVPALAYARRYLAVDELAEEAHRQVIVLLGLTGDRAGALRQFERCAAMLQRELGVSPQARTRAAYEAVRDGHGGLQSHLPGADDGGRTWLSSASEPGAALAPDSAPLVPLPAPTVPLIGRTGEVATTTDLLLRPDVRLLTISGPGGGGKTRLALQVAWELRDRMADGAVFVPLAPLRDVSEVAGAVARACGVQASGPALVCEVLHEYLRDKAMLLVLDNCEHLPAAAPLIAEILSGCPGLRVLATSRSVLNLAGEHVLDLPPLPLPDPATLSDIAALSEAPAVMLLLSRAQANNPAFRLTEANAADLAAICVRLDGLPLAIELAAARLKVLSPRALLERLDRRLPLLSDGPRDLAERHQALRATIDWSYRLLGANERSLFARLATFVGGWTLDAAESVCALPGEPAYAVLDGLQTLLDAHLLVRTTGADGEPRFGMLETIREYATELLESSETAVQTARAHARFFLALAEQAAAHRGADAGRWFDRLDEEHPNMLTAIAWALEQGDSATALRLTEALGRYWLTRGNLRDGRLLLEGALALPPTHREVDDGGSATEAWRARAHEAAAELALSQGEFAVACDHMRTGAQIWRGLGRLPELALSLLSLSDMARIAGDQVEAAATWAEGETLARDLAEPRALARVASGSGRRARGTADIKQAAAWLEIALAEARQRGDGLFLVNRLVDIVPVTLAGGDVERARSQANETLAIARAYKHRVAMAMALNDLGEIARVRGDYAEAQAHYSESLRLFQQMGNRSDVPRLLHNLGYVALHDGDLELAAAHFCRSLGRFRKRQIARGAVEVLAGLAAFMARRGRPLQAARMWGAAEAAREAADWVRWPADAAEDDHYQAQARVEAGAALFASAWHAGRALSIDEALAEMTAGTVRDLVPAPAARGAGTPATADDEGAPVVGAALSA
jgi:predicted ATPase/DNA-binding SARP family transcriptional activator